MMHTARDEMLAQIERGARNQEPFPASLEGLSTHERRALFLRLPMAALVDVLSELTGSAKLTAAIWHDVRLAAAMSTLLELDGGQMDGWGLWDALQQDAQIRREVGEIMEGVIGVGAAGASRARSPSEQGGGSR